MEYWRPRRQHGEVDGCHAAAQPSLGHDTSRQEIDNSLPDELSAIQRALNSTRLASIIASITLVIVDYHRIAHYFTSPRHLTSLRLHSPPSPLSASALRTLRSPASLAFPVHTRELLLAWLNGS